MSTFYNLSRHLSSRKCFVLCVCVRCMWRDHSRQHNVAVYFLLHCPLFYNWDFCFTLTTHLPLQLHLHSTVQLSVVFQGIWVLFVYHCQFWAKNIDLWTQRQASLLLKRVIEQQIQRHFLRIWQHGRKDYSSKTLKLISCYRSIFTCTFSFLKYYNTSTSGIALLLRLVIPFALCLISGVRRDTGQTFGHLCPDHSETESPTLHRLLSSLKTLMITAHMSVYHRLFHGAMVSGQIRTETGAAVMSLTSHFSLTTNDRSAGATPV